MNTVAHPWSALGAVRDPGKSRKTRQAIPEKSEKVVNNFLVMPLELVLTDLPLRKRQLAPHEVPDSELL